MSPRELIFAFFLSLAVIAGPAIHSLFENDLSQVPDTSTYLAVARFDFDQSPVRRYRLIVPMLAALTDYVTGGLTEKLAPSHFKGDFSLAFSFFAINFVLMGLLGLLTYRLCRAYDLSRPFALIGTIALLTARYTAVFAALPLVDSLYCVAVAMALLAVKTKNTPLLIAAIFLGPLSRESFIFVAPVILFFGHLKFAKTLFLFLLSGAIAFALHYVYDLLCPPAVGWLKADLGHVPNLWRQLPLLFSFYGLYKCMINLGIWMLIPISLLFIRRARRRLFRMPEPYVMVFLFFVLIQMLLSGSMERISYQAMPLFAVLTGYSAGLLWSVTVADKIQTESNN